MLVIEISVTIKKKKLISLNFTDEIFLYFFVTINKLGNYSIPTMHISYSCFFPCTVKIRETPETL